MNIFSRLVRLLNSVFCHFSSLEVYLNSPLDSNNPLFNLLFVLTFKQPSFLSFLKACSPYYHPLPASQSVSNKYYVFPNEKFFNFSAFPSCFYTVSFQFKTFPPKFSSQFSPYSRSCHSHRRPFVLASNNTHTQIYKYFISFFPSIFLQFLYIFTFS